VQRKVYLAGPEVFLAESREIGAAKRVLCAEAGLDGLYPGDLIPPAAGPAAIVARAIFDHCIGMMHRADLVIANLTPFRGPSADVGTAFELGYMQALGKPCFAYSNDPNDILDRVRRLDPLVRHDPRRDCWIDCNGLMIEAFGGFDNLMLECGLAAPAVLRNVPVERRYTDLEGFRACLALARRAS